MNKFFLMLLMALPLSLLAQKVAVVNTEEIISKMPEQVAATKQLNELAEKYRLDLKSMDDEFAKKTEEFVKEKDSLLENIRNRRQQELQDIQTRYQQSYQTMQEDLQKRQQQLFAPIQQKVADAIKKVGDEENCAYIMEAGMMLYTGAAAIDLTAKVKAKLGIK